MTKPPGRAGRKETIVNVRQRFGRVPASSQASVPPPTGSAVLLQDEDDQDDVEAMEMLQDLLLERCRTLGVSIEAKPSSNVYISRMEHYEEHPIFRWHPPDPGRLAAQAPCNRFSLRTEHVDVLINTDDQGIIPTSLRGEFDLIREAATAAGVSREDVDAWLVGIRTSGIAHFERNHRSVFASLPAGA